MSRFLLIPVFFLSFTVAFSQTTGSGVSRPKLVVGVMVDQMRWDFLYRFKERYAANGGFNRLMNQGFNCENALIDYAQTVTACGHSCVYTGSVPAIHGIAGNDWYDKVSGEGVYCTDDPSVQGLGGAGAPGQMSPKNMLTTTFADEIRMATNFRGKTVGIAIKDRGGILPAGHSANAAYWYDARTGTWITSSYYMKELPKWVSDFNAKKLPDTYYKQGWSTLYPLETYVNSTADAKDYEGKAFGADQKGFPYKTEGFAGKNYGLVSVMPQGNEMTLEISKAALEAEQLGADNFTDVLAISLSSPDYIGHTFGPNSIEVEDMYLRLDKQLGDFLDYLDTKIGKGQYLFFLTADHGVAHVPAFLNENKIPAGKVSAEWYNGLQQSLREKFGTERVLQTTGLDLNINNKVIDSMRIDREKVVIAVTDFLERQPFVSRVIDMRNLGCSPLPDVLREKYAMGYYPTRSPDLEVILKPHYMYGSAVGTTHGNWSPYDAHIPLVFYGWNVKPGSTYRQISMTDVAPTITSMLHVQMPSGNIGHPILEIVGGSK